MDRKELLKLIREFRDELREREFNEYAQLFGDKAEEMLTALVSRLTYMPEHLSADIVYRVTSKSLMPVLDSAGYPKRVMVSEGERVAPIRDDTDSLGKIRNIFCKLNKAANGGLFRNHDITYKTNKIMEWLGRDIEIIRMWEDNQSPGF